MTATLFLIRHAAHGHLGQILSGRSDGLALTAEGRAQAATLAARLAGTAFDAIQSSPIQRARETALAIAEARELPVEPAPALNEIDFGAWTGRRFAELSGDAAWDEWNRRRSTACPPDGESMAAAQVRAMDHIRGWACGHPGGTAAMVTHCDIIRALVAGVLGLSLDRIHQFEIAPASISRIEAGDWGARILSVNEGV